MNARKNGKGVYRSERSYCSFYRQIPLPEGTISDQAKANFKDGVLEITMPAAPEEVRRGVGRPQGDVLRSPQASLL